MGDNVMVSFDEEKLMNEILDQGIDELKKSNPHAKTNSFNKTYSSNVDYNPNKDLIGNKKHANLNPNLNGSNDLHAYEANYTSERIGGSRIEFYKDGNVNQSERVDSNFNPEAMSKLNQIKSYIKEGIESKSNEEFNSKNINYQREIGNSDLLNNNNYNNNNSNKNFNSYGYINHKKNLAELKNNYSISDNTNTNNNDEFLSRNYHNQNTTFENNKIILNQNEINNNNANKGLGSFKNQLGAEGQIDLNDETIQIINNQSMKNNLLNSNNSNTNSRGEVAKSSALRALLDEMKSKGAYLNESNENNLANVYIKNNTARTENLNSNSPLGPNLNMNNNYFGDEISKTERMNNILTNDFIVNNNNQNNLNSYTNFTNIPNSNPNRARNISVDSVNSNAEMNFDDMKSEIDNLQSKIDGLEKKLFENTSSKESFDVNFNSQSALKGIKRRSEDLNTSKSSTKRSTSKNKLYQSIKHQPSPKNLTDSIMLKSKYMTSSSNLAEDKFKKGEKYVQQKQHKHSYSTYGGAKVQEDLDYRKKYNSKLNLRSKYAMLFDGDGCRNIDTSPEFSPVAADRSHYKSPTSAALNNRNSVSTKEKGEKVNQSICSKNSKHSTNSRKSNLASSFISKNIGNSTDKSKKLYADKLSFSRGVYEEDVSRRAKANLSNTNNQSILSDTNNKTQDEGDEFNSKRVADIIAKTKSILGRSASREPRDKGKSTKNAVLTVLKTEKASEADLAADYSNCGSDAENNNDSNYNNINNLYNNDYSDNERIIKPKGFKSNLNQSISKDKKDFNKTPLKSKSKSKAKSKSKTKKKIYITESNFNADSLLTFTNNNTNLISYESASRVSSRKAKKTAAASNRINTGSNRSFSINTYANKSKITEQKDKEKILKLKERNNELKLELKTERRKNEELDKTMKKIRFKEENFDMLQKNFVALQKEFEKMQKSYNQSEIIRKEQAKLIKSMKYEIELLKEGR